MANAMTLQEDRSLKRFLRRFCTLICCVAVGAGAVQFGPSLMIRLFGSSTTQWISQQLSETLREKNELVVYEVETTGIETVTQDAWLIGTVQQVELTYSFCMNFTVDLSKAQVTAEENTITVSIPDPVPGYQKLTVDENQVRKTDWLYPLTPERYAAILKQVEDKLYANASENSEYQQNAWNVAVQNLESLFSSVADQHFLGEGSIIRVVRLEKQTEM